MLDNLENATLEIKSLVPDALDIKVYSRGIDGVEIKGVIPLDLTLPTNARTWGCLIVLDYNQSSGKESLSIIPQSYVIPHFLQRM